MFYRHRNHYLSLRQSKQVRKCTHSVTIRQDVTTFASCEWQGNPRSGRNSLSTHSLTQNARWYPCKVAVIVFWLIKTGKFSEFSAKLVSIKCHAKSYFRTLTFVQTARRMDGRTEALSDIKRHSEEPLARQADGGGSRFLWNVCQYLPDYTMLYPRTQPSFR
jgi:hypothetical protein